MTQRSVEKTVTAHRQAEGGGFVVRRPFPTQGLDMVDPFLMIDEMGPVEYGPGQAIGAPAHPHRGFETITYILDGEVEHKDSAGHSGVILPGGVQWMTAGSGVVHSEMPTARMMEQGGRMHGFQIWLNLPAKDKMTPPRYQERRSEEIPTALSSDGLASGRIIAGKALGVEAVISTHSPIHMHHWTLKAGARVDLELDAGLSALVYVFEGAAQVGAALEPIFEGQVAMMGPGEGLTLATPEHVQGSTQLLVLAGKPLAEPVSRYGPFVMNHPHEIHEAIADFQSGKMGRIAAELA